ncbi:MAG: hypothetical protein A2888_03555 [Chlamydiae bacterium RIFCSPLOWO2_01_FULL_28_7]|nr:MAG: hypothetical protein A2888_03555 [Chlamydiae bacterium RIFCSPLOWO2_01_FULL_28_7]
MSDIKIESSRLSFNDIKFIELKGKESYYPRKDEAFKYQHVDISFHNKSKYEILEIFNQIEKKAINPNFVFLTIKKLLTENHGNKLILQLIDERISRISQDRASVEIKTDLILQKNSKSILITSILIIGVFVAKILVNNFRFSNIKPISAGTAETALEVLDFKDITRKISIMDLFLSQLLKVTYKTYKYAVFAGIIFYFKTVNDEKKELEIKNHELLLKLTEKNRKIDKYKSQINTLMHDTKGEYKKLKGENIKFKRSVERMQAEIFSITSRFKRFKESAQQNFKQLSQENIDLISHNNTLSVERDRYKLMTEIDPELAEITL